jgi:predicted transposase YbfD/YdcC
VLPVAAAGDLEEGWASVRQIARVIRTRQIKKKGQWMIEQEVAYLIASLSADESTPADILNLNREHWSIENKLHRNKDVILGEDRYTNRSDHAPRNIFSINNLVLGIFKAVRLSPKRALEHFQDDKNRAIHAVCGLL